MAKTVRFSRHADQKFVDLAELGFIVTREQVSECVLNPETVDHQADPPITQCSISANRVLRVVFVEEETEILIVTFYPGRKSRYE